MGRKILILIRKWIAGFEVKMEKDNTMIAAAVNEQIQLGLQNLRKGVISSRFRTIQEYHYSAKNCNPKYFNGDIWAKRVVLALMKFSKEMWLKRCKIVHEKNDNTLEKRTRLKARELFLNLKQNPWNLESADRKLLERKMTYFEVAQMSNINSWVTRVNLALYKTAMKEKRKKCTLRSWIKAGIIGVNERAEIARRNEKKFFEKEKSIKNHEGGQKLVTSFFFKK